MPSNLWKFEWSPGEIICKFIKFKVLKFFLTWSRSQSGTKISTLRSTGTRYKPLPISSARVYFFGTKKQKIESIGGLAKQCQFLLQRCTFLAPKKQKNRVHRRSYKLLPISSARVYFFGTFFQNLTFYILVTPHSRSRFARTTVARHGASRRGSPGLHSKLP